jgi:hypothetical protein
MVLVKPFPADRTGLRFGGCKIHATDDARMTIKQRFGNFDTGKMSGEKTPAGDADAPL